METLLDPTDNVQVQHEAENHSEIIRCSRKGCHWDRIYPRCECTPEQIRYIWENNILKQLPRSPTVEDFLRVIILLFKQISIQVP